MNVCPVNSRGLRPALALCSRWSLREAFTSHYFRHDYSKRAGAASRMASFWRKRRVALKSFLPAISRLNVSKKFPLVLR